MPRAQCDERNPIARTAGSRDRSPRPAAHLEGARIARAQINRPDLRWPLPVDLMQVLTGATVTALRRRSKYLLADLEGRGTVLWHLGMSGRMLVEVRAWRGSTAIRASMRATTMSC